MILFSIRVMRNALNSEPAAAGVGGLRSPTPYEVRGRRRISSGAPSARSGALAPTGVLRTRMKCAELRARLRQFLFCRRWRTAQVTHRWSALQPPTDFPDTFRPFRILFFSNAPWSFRILLFQTSSGMFSVSELSRPTSPKRLRKSKPRAGSARGVGFPRAGYSSAN